MSRNSTKFKRQVWDTPKILLNCTHRITVNTVSISHLVRSGGAGLEQDGDDVGVGGLGGGGEVQRRVAVQVNGVDGGTVIHQQLHNLQKGYHLSLRSNTI